MATMKFSWIFIALVAHVEGGSNSSFLAKDADVAQNEKNMFNTSNTTIATVMNASMQEPAVKMSDLKSLNGTKMACTGTQKPSDYNNYLTCRKGCFNTFDSCKLLNKPECLCGHNGALCILTCADFSHPGDTSKDCQVKCSDVKEICNGFKLADESKCASIHFNCLMKCFA